MGEVFKAEDLKLDQTVALKFLPDHFDEDVGARESRLMTSDFRDPLVGRDILVGGLLGLGPTALPYILSGSLSSADVGLIGEV